MKNNLLTSAYSFLLITSLCTACGGKDNEKPRTTVTGAIRLFDEFGHEQTDRSGVRIAVADAPTATATSAADGTFSISNVSAGNHRFLLSKNGYGSYQSAELSVSGASTSLGTPVRLGQMPSWTIGGMPRSSFVDLLFVGSTSVPSTRAEPRSGRVYLRAGAQYPTPTKYDYTFRLTDRYDRFFQDSIPYIKLETAGLPVGRLISYSIFPENPAADSYVDPVSGKEIYPTVREDGNQGNQGGFQYP